MKFKPEIVEISFSVHVWDAPHYPRQWIAYGQRSTIEAARQRCAELRERFKRVRIMEHRRTATVVV